MTIDSAVWLSVFPLIVLGVAVWRERRRSRRGSLATPSRDVSELIAGACPGQDATPPHVAAISAGPKAFTPARVGAVETRLVA